MKVRLIVVRGNTSKSAVSLTLPAVIGRGRQADLTVSHPLVSRRHCQIVEHVGYVWIQDLGSTNGTYLGTQRVEQALLPSGATLIVGPLSFRVEHDGATDPTAAMADQPISSVSSVPAGVFAEVPEGAPISETPHSNGPCVVFEDAAPASATDTPLPHDGPLGTAQGQPGQSLNEEPMAEPAFDIPEVPAPGAIDFSNLPGAIDRPEQPAAQPVEPPWQHDAWTTPSTVQPLGIDAFDSDHIADALPMEDAPVEPVQSWGTVEEDDDEGDQPEPTPPPPIPDHLKRPHDSEKS